MSDDEKTAEMTLIVTYSPGSSDDTVERVARALHAAEHCGHPDEFTEVDPRCYADARAVLAALACPAPTKESQ